MKLILASASPRRRELLTQLLTDLNLASDFEISAADIDETALPQEIPHHYVKRLAREKAEAVAQTSDKKKHPCGLIIGADTVVIIDKQILGKPKDINDAKYMLQILSGKNHQVITGICLIYWGNDQNQSIPNSKPISTIKAEIITTHVTFKNLSDAEINNYITTGEPMDKAGAYAIQGGAGSFVTKLEGSFHNVVGLPTEWLGEQINAFWPKNGILPKNH